MKRIHKNIELSGTWVFGSGNCISLPVSVYRVSQPVNQENGRYSEYFDYGERNGYRMKPYHRLDLGISFIKQKRWGERRWVFSLFNAYSRRNPFYVDVRHKEKPGFDQLYQKYEYVQYSLFPIIPSISYQFKF